ncbi:hypothetical protein BBBOND_0303040 [Babesia bigemina]|uniref:Uncharacterized protein n=1 Tax=Babesia bigemina TaxID=5866 RepID=A0A061DDN0_BABBI|nr:hypothetical protein BBBOND_0303040 [Babesia bigemina]CDR96400.1 hypothetical protein BBBOND_0303040 [Babesia bigemina]|eukprot:XP_012768586.1 hypothetical protein BBBOND_0303040 [Babesia bigemina]
MAPHFKKLTDCPENLRESIDWLIQIRNGGDKTGLQNLAKALDKLINKAIEDAENSLKAEEEKLKCPIIYEGNLSYCQINEKSLKEAEKKLEELKEKNDSESLSKKTHLEDEIKLFTGYKQKCIEYTHPRYPDSKALKDVRAQLKGLQALSKTLNPFFNKLNKTTKNDGDSILHNLFDGLEKFLGYSSTSKCYDGNGIVYSDLDRLCDAVMYFILKCLECNKDLLTHYYPSITENIEALKNNIGNGLGVKGLGKAIQKIKEGLQGYERVLTSRSQKVISDLSNYASQMPARNAHLWSVQHKGLSQIIDRFNLYINNAKETMRSIRNNSEGFAGLDGALKNKLSAPFEKINEGINILQNSLQTDDFVKALNVVQRTFDVLPSKVERIISENVNGTISEHENAVNRYKQHVKNDIEKSRDTFLTERLKVAITDLNNSINCAQLNALNLGGLRNDVVKHVVEAIETRFKSVDEDVDDEDTLKELKTGTVAIQIENITENLNEEKALLEVTSKIKSVQVDIGEPDEIFNKAHQIGLQKLVMHAQTNLQEALKCAQENAKNMGGLKNGKVAGVIDNIQKKFNEVDNIKTIRELQELESNFMKGEIQKITEILNNENAAGVTSTLNSLQKNIVAPQKLFDDNYTTILAPLAKQSQKEMLATVENATECITTHGVLHKQKIKEALEKIENTLQEIETPAVGIEKLYQVVTGVEEQLNQLDSKIGSSLQATVKPAIQKLNDDFMTVKNLVKQRRPTTNAELIFLITATRTYAVEALHLAETYSVDASGSPNTDISGVASTIRHKNLELLDDAFSNKSITGLHTRINGHLSKLNKTNGSYKGSKPFASFEIDDLTTKIREAEKSLIRSLVGSAKPRIDHYFTTATNLTGQLDDHDTTGLKRTLGELKGSMDDPDKITDINEFSSLVKKVGTQFQKLRTQHSSPSNSTFKSLFHVILEIEKPAWKAIIQIESTVFQTAINIARAAVSAAVEKAKKDIKAAEDEYQIAVGKIRARIETAVERLQEQAAQDQFRQVTSGISPLFEEIAETVTSKSIYLEDMGERKKYFAALKALIDHTVTTLEATYQKAYQSAAKSYLSGAIGMIKTAVDEAEEKYVRAVETRILQIQSKLNGVREGAFKSAEKRGKLETAFNEDFVALELEVNKNSAFTDDFSKRRDCFIKVKEIITNTVKSLSTAYKEAYKSSAKTYLTKAIIEIESKVSDAEKKYTDASAIAVQAITSAINGLGVENFKVNEQRERLTDIFTEHFKNLQKAVESKSAFKQDFNSRTECFENLKSLMNRTIETLVKAANTFDACATMATEYLNKSFNDADTRIKALGSIIKMRVKKAFDQIISEVYEMYAAEKRAQLEALKTCITEQLRTISKILEEDRRMGVKGLLKTLSGDNPNSLDPRNRLQNVEDKTSVKLLAPLIMSYLDSILIYIWNDIETSTDSHFSDGHFYKSKIEEIKTALNEVFNHLIDTKDKIYNYDYVFVNLLEKLNNVLDDLSPQEFGAMAYPVLDALRKGMAGFTEQLNYAYINKYEGSKAIEWYVDGQKQKPSQDATRCAKIFLTLIPEWDKHLPYLKRECIRGWNKTQINTQKGNKLGLWFERRGYRVSTSDETQDGELRNNAGCQGTNINTCMATLIPKVNFGNLLYNLYQYYRVCQSKFSDQAKPPTTICQMLHWFCGLEYTPMYENVKSYLQEWFNDFKKEHEIEKALPATMPKRTGHEVFTDFNLGNLLGSYQNVTIRASEVLLTILGYGDADGRYACEFYTNPYNLYYPTDKSKCFDMLVDICLRLNHQLRFLYMQCHNGPRSSGWADCRYGKNIAGSAWNCNRLQCVENGCNQNCKWHNDCGVKSPLQSFLEDGLKGFLPHQFNSPSCKLDCSVKNHNGIPCKTPMGFADISITASWTKTGRDIKKVLDPFCGTLPDSLSLLCAYFLCLLRRPPQTLCDMFAFYENFFEHWKGHYDSVHKGHVKKHKHDAFYAAVASANFGVEYDGLDPTTMFGSSSHSSAATTHLEGDLFAIVNCKPNENPVHPCGSYLQPLSYEVRCVFTEKLAADYLSWIVYITETFYNLLNDLYNKCTKCCIQQQADCCGRICAKGCTVDSTAEPAESKKLTHKTHGELCNSILQCAGIHPTIFAAGFTFGSPWNLSGDNGVEKKRSCKDFCTALGMVVRENNVLYMLVHEKIPAFLWEIRYKFFYTLVALWAYSLLYLLYVIIGRLDTFHIRSHLRLPSSHKISAQSLLATARLNDLAKLAYLRT